MGGGSSSPPPIQNPGATATQQQQLNTTAGQQSQSGTALSESQGNPYGNLSVTQTGVDQYGNPIYGSSLNFSPAQQSLYNTLTGTQQMAGNQGAGLLAGANYGATNPTTAIGNESSGTTNMMMNQWLQSQAPWMQMQETQLDTQLKNQGLNPSPTATSDPSTWGPYEQQMNQLRQSQQMGVSGAAAQFEPTAFNQAESMYTLPAQLGLQLSQFGQPTSPGNSLVQTTPLNISPANYEGDVNAYNQQIINEWQAQQQAQGQLYAGILGALGNVAGAGLKYSDRRLKTDIMRIGKLKNGLSIYSYKTLGEQEIGLMADEVEQLYPEAVVEDPNGFKLVNYALAVR